MFNIANNEYAEIPLTQGQVALVDWEMFDVVNQFKWFAAWSSSGKYFYAVRNIRTVNGKRTRQYMAQFIWEYKFGPIPKGFTIDHILTERTLDNHLSNLRLADKRGQKQNHGIPSNAAEYQSKYPGVSWHKGIQKWHSHIQFGKTKIHLGCYDSDEVGYAAYCWALKLLGFPLPINHKRDHPGKLFISAKTRAFVEKQLLKYGVDIIW